MWDFVLRFLRSAYAARVIKMLLEFFADWLEEAFA